MAFTHTAAELLGRVKTVTRRTGWHALSPGDLLQAVRKARGLAEGEPVETLAVLRVTDVRREPLSRLLTDARYAEDELPREGFPCWSAREFVDMFVRINRLRDAGAEVTRIAFEYVDDPPPAQARQPRTPPQAQSNPPAPPTHTRPPTSRPHARQRPPAARRTRRSRD